MREAVFGLRSWSHGTDLLRDLKPTDSSSFSTAPKCLTTWPPLIDLSASDDAHQRKPLRICPNQGVVDDVNPKFPIQMIAHQRMRSPMRERGNREILLRFVFMAGGRVVLLECEGRDVDRDEKRHEFIL